MLAATGKDTRLKILGEGIQKGRRGGDEWEKFRDAALKTLRKHIRKRDNYSICFYRDSFRGKK